MASTLKRATFFVSFSCSASLQYFQSHSMWSHRTCIILGAQSDALNLIFSFCLCCLTCSTHCLPICPFFKFSHPILSCSINTSLRYGKVPCVSVQSFVHGYPKVIRELPVCHRLPRLCPRFFPVHACAYRRAS
jgi:hypothetical protein